MKQRNISLLLSLLGLLTGMTVTAIAQDQKFTCQVYHGSFVLDDNDFKAMQDATLRDGRKVTRETFPSLSPKMKVIICDT
jgi:hypothetical protein